MNDGRSFDTAIPLTVNQTAYSDLSSGERYFSLDAQSGYEYHIRSLNGFIIGRMYLYDENRNLIYMDVASHNTTNVGTQPFVIHLAQRSETVYIKYADGVSSQAIHVRATASEYTLPIGDSFNNAIPIPKDVEIKSHVSSALPNRYFSLDVVEGMKYSFISNTTSLYDTHVYLYDSGMNLIESHEDVWNSANFTITANQTDVYYMHVKQANEAFIAEFVVFSIEHEPPPEPEFFGHFRGVRLKNLRYGKLHIPYE